MCTCHFGLIVLRDKIQKVSKSSIVALFSFMIPTQCISLARANKHVWNDFKGVIILLDTLRLSIILLSIHTSNHLRILSRDIIRGNTFLGKKIPEKKYSRMIVVDQCPTWIQMSIKNPKTYFWTIPEIIMIYH